MERTPERAQFLSDVLTTAIEAGWPWFRVEQYQYRDYPDGEVTVYAGERQGDDTQAIVCQVDYTDKGEVVGEPMTLDLDAAARGLKALITFYETALPSQSETIRRLRHADRDNDAGDIDAHDADNIAQMALLGEIVYG